MLDTNSKKNAQQVEYDRVAALKAAHRELLTRRATLEATPGYEAKFEALSMWREIEDAERAANGAELGYKIRYGHAKFVVERHYDDVALDMVDLIREHDDAIDDALFRRDIAAELFGGVDHE